LPSLGTPLLMVDGPIARMPLWLGKGLGLGDEKLETVGDWRKRKKKRRTKRKGNAGREKGEKERR
jgi:hypothetical protein